MSSYSKSKKMEGVYDAIEHYKIIFVVYVVCTCFTGRFAVDSRRIIV